MNTDFFPWTIEPFMGINAVTDPTQEGRRNAFEDYYTVLQPVFPSLNPSDIKFVAVKVEMRDFLALRLLVLCQSIAPFAAKELSPKIATHCKSVHYAQTLVCLMEHLEYPARNAETLHLFIDELNKLRDPSDIQGLLHCLLTIGDKLFSKDDIILFFRIFNSNLGEADEQGDKLEFNKSLLDLMRETPQQFLFYHPMEKLLDIAKHIKSKETVCYLMLTLVALRMLPNESTQILVECVSRLNGETWSPKNFLDILTPIPYHSLSSRSLKTLINLYLRIEFDSRGSQFKSSVFYPVLIDLLNTSGGAKINRILEDLETIRPSPPALEHFIASSQFAYIRMLSTIPSSEFNDHFLKSFKVDVQPDWTPVSVNYLNCMDAELAAICENPNIYDALLLFFNITRDAQERLSNGHSTNQLPTLLAFKVKVDLLNKVTTLSLNKVNAVSARMEHVQQHQSIDQRTTYLLLLIQELCSSSPNEAAIPKKITPFESIREWQLFTELVLSIPAGLSNRVGSYLAQLPSSHRYYFLNFQKNYPLFFGIISPFLNASKDLLGLYQDLCQTNILPERIDADEAQVIHFFLTKFKANYEWVRNLFQTFRIQREYLLLALEAFDMDQTARLEKMILPVNTLKKLEPGIKACYLTYLCCVSDVKEKEALQLISSIASTKGYEALILLLSMEKKIDVDLCQRINNLLRVHLKEKKAYDLAFLVSLTLALKIPSNDVGAVVDCLHPYSVDDGREFALVMSLKDVFAGAFNVQNMNTLLLLCKQIISRGFDPCLSISRLDKLTNRAKRQLLNHHRGVALFFDWLNSLPMNWVGKELIWFIATFEARSPVVQNHLLIEQFDEPKIANMFAEVEKLGYQDLEDDYQLIKHTILPIFKHLFYFNFTCIRLRRILQLVKAPGNISPLGNNRLEDPSFQAQLIRTKILSFFEADLPAVHALRWDPLNGEQTHFCLGLIELFEPNTVVHRFKDFIHLAKHFPYECKKALFLVCITFEPNMQHTILSMAQALCDFAQLMKNQGINRSGMQALLLILFLKKGEFNHFTPRNRHTLLPYSPEQIAELCKSVVDFQQLEDLHLLQKVFATDELCYTHHLNFAPFFYLLQKNPNVLKGMPHIKVLLLQRLAAHPSAMNLANLCFDFLNQKPGFTDVVMNNIGTINAESVPCFLNGLMNMEPPTNVALSQNPLIEAISLFSQEDFEFWAANSPIISQQWNDTLVQLPRGFFIFAVSVLARETQMENLEHIFDVDVPITIYSRSMDTIACINRDYFTVEDADNIVKLHRTLNLSTDDEFFQFQKMLYSLPEDDRLNFIESSLGFLSRLESNEQKWSAIAYLSLLPPDQRDDIFEQYLQFIEDQGKPFTFMQYFCDDENLPAIVDSYLKEQMDLFETDQKSLFHLATWILDCRSILVLSDMHPINIQATEAFAASDPSEKIIKSPFHVFAEQLRALKNDPFIPFSPPKVVCAELQVSIDLEGLRKKWLNRKPVSRDDLPQSDIKRVYDHLCALDGDLNFPNLKLFFTTSRLIKDLVSVIANPALKLDKTALKFAWILEWIMQDTEERFGLYLHSLDTCDTGKKASVHLFYQRIAAQLKRHPASNLAEEIVGDLIDEAVYDLMSDVFGHPDFLQQVSGCQQISERVHQTNFLKNTWLKQVGYHHELAIDKGSTTVKDEFLNITPKQFLSTFFQFCNPSALGYQVSEKIKSWFRDGGQYEPFFDLMKEKIRAHDLPPDGIGDFFILDDTNNVVGMTERGIVLLLKATGYLV